MNPIFEGPKNNITLYEKPVPYHIKPGMVYCLYYNHTYEYAFLKEEDGIPLPTPLFDIFPDIRKRLITSFHKNYRGVNAIFYGYQGFGKTVLANMIAKEMNLPIIIIDSPIASYSDTREIIEAVGDCVILYDEYEKRWREDHQKEHLAFLDGNHTPQAKIMSIMIVNEMSINRYLKDRPSRMWYAFRFNEMSKLLIEKFIHYFLGEHDTVQAFEEIYYLVIEYFHNPTPDNIQAFVKEYINYRQDLSLKEVIEPMNIKLKNNDLDSLSSGDYQPLSMVLGSSSTQEDV